MEQRNYSDHNDIRPIEELLGRPRPSLDQTPPDIYGSRHKSYASPAEPKKAASQPMHTQKVMPDSFVNTKLPDGPMPVPKKKRKDGSGFLSAAHRSPLLWGLLGFAVGVTFWHTVGFWNFMEDAVLKTPNQAHSQLSASVYNRQAQALARQAAQRQAIQGHSGQVSIVPVAERLKACVTLLLDRRRGKTYAVPCKPNMRFYRGRKVLRTSAQMTH